MGHTLTIRLDPELAEWLESEARRMGVSQGRLVRDQLEKAKADARSKPFMRLAGIVRGGPRDVSMRRGFSRR